VCVKTCRWRSGGESAEWESEGREEVMNQIFMGRMEKAGQSGKQGRLRRRTEDAG